MSLIKTQSKYWAEKDTNTIESFWNNEILISRGKWFAEQLKQFKFDSIFEIGFFSGRNLKIIDYVFSDVHVNGLDVNKKAVDFAKNKLPKAELIHMDLHDMYKLNKKYDIVFSSGVLIHVPPDEIQHTILKCLDISNKYVMHLETNGNNEVVAGPKSLNPTYKISDQLQWAPKISSVYKNLGFNVRAIKLPDEFKSSGTSELIIVNKSE